MDFPSTEKIAQLEAVLCDESAELSHRFRVLFTFKNLGQRGDVRSIMSISQAFNSDSALLKHELAYCLGQIASPLALPKLEAVLRDDKQDPMVRHEAAEAIGAISQLESLPLLQEFLSDSNVSVRETCEIAIEKIKYDYAPTAGTSQNKMPTIDPAPAMQDSLEDIRSLYLDTSKPLFLRYRAMFALRDLALDSDSRQSKKAVETLAEGFDDTSALFKHEIAYIFGQISHPASVPSLLRVLNTADEAEMVRHEAAEALGGLGDEQGVMSALTDFAKRSDAPRVVRESCIVALDMISHEQSGAFEYCDALVKPIPSVAVPVA